MPNVKEDHRIQNRKFLTKFHYLTGNLSLSRVSLFFMSVPNVSMNFFMDYMVRTAITSIKLKPAFKGALLT